MLTEIGFVFRGTILHQFIGKILSNELVKNPVKNP